MSRTGLTVALVIAAVVGALFGLYPRLDLTISSLFFDPHAGFFMINAQPWVMHSRAAARWLTALIFAPAALAIIGKLLMPGRRMLIGARAALFLALTMGLGPGILANVILKDHWGRARPIDVREFGGAYHFTAWWDPRGDCPHNCSFIAGEPSGAFWTLAPAALVPPQWRLLAYGGAFAFGAAVGLLRIGGGGHFFTDVVFAGVFMFVLIWLAHGLLFRWPTARPTGVAIARPPVRLAQSMREAFATLMRRLGRQPGKTS